MLFTLQRRGRQPMNSIDAHAALRGTSGPAGRATAIASPQAGSACKGGEHAESHAPINGADRMDARNQTMQNVVTFAPRRKSQLCILNSIRESTNLISFGRMNSFQLSQHRPISPAMPPAIAMMWSVTDVFLTWLAKCQFTQTLVITVKSDLRLPPWTSAGCCYTESWNG